MIRSIAECLRRARNQLRECSCIRSLRTPRRRYNIEFELSPRERGSYSTYNDILGTYLDYYGSEIEWSHDDFAQVGDSSVLTITLVCSNGSPYLFKSTDALSCMVVSTSGQERIEVPHVIEPMALTGRNTFQVSFTAKVSGRYIINIKINGRPIKGGDIYRQYLPGLVDSNKTVFLDNTAVLVVTKGVYTAMKIIPKDSYGNDTDVQSDLVNLEIRKDCISGRVIDHEFVAFKNDNGCYELLLKLDQEGHYVGSIQYAGKRLGPPHFTILSLSESDAKRVEVNTSCNNLNIYYDAMLAEQKKTVYCYIFPRQLQVRQYFLKFIMTRSSTYKVSPSTQIIYHADPKLFTIDDGFQDPITLVSAHRNILGATVHKFMLKNIGGSEKFKDKETFFFNKLKEHHQQQSSTNRSQKSIVVSRFNLVESAIKATEHFSAAEWCKKFYIKFEGEEGLDYGGLSREFFDVLSVELFDVSNKLFMRFNEEDQQGLIRPNPSHSRPSKWKLKHFFFAGKIVGKCLFESAMGNPQLIKARFTRSFLAQIIGLRVNYKYFETDDPSLYTNKIQYILENEVTDLELVFAEEEFHATGVPPTIVPLIKNGDKVEVTEVNKIQYLDVLSQYKLTKCVREEIEHFVKGLHEIVPDDFLSIFNENELELLMCGLGTVSFEDMKLFAVVRGFHGAGHQQVLSWFWSVTSSFNQEEMAKLLQFVTGSSQLPPGGFRDLEPKFTITTAPLSGRLPTSHTCFNRLCLPSYNSYEQFRNSLMIALNDGSQGFAME